MDGIRILRDIDLVFVCLGFLGLVSTRIFIFLWRR